MTADFLTDLIITKLYAVNMMYSETGSTWKTTNRNRWGIVMKTEGETEYMQNNETIVSNNNYIILLPKGTNYFWRCTNAGHYYMTEFDSPKIFDRILRFPITDSEKYIKIFRDLEYKKMLKTPQSEFECIKDIYDIILRLVSSSPRSYSPSDKKSKIQPALDYIAKNPDKNIKNDDLAKLTELSTVYFRKLFTEVCGVAPITYIHELRIKKAKQMLHSDFGHISDISQSLGYKSVYDFSRTFKKHTGLSPTAYAKLKNNL